MKTVALLLVFTCHLHATAQSSNLNTLTWDFPLTRTHTGILLGNGVQGLMIWGEGNKLNITIGRAGFWDHRGGVEFSANTTFAEVKKFLEAKDEGAVRRAFQSGNNMHPDLRPHQVGGGRLEVTLPTGYVLKTGALDWRQAVVKLVAEAGNKEVTFMLRQSVTHELAWLELPPPLINLVKVKLIPAWDFISEELRKQGVAAPTAWTKTGPSGLNVSGFTQTLPEDDPLSIAYAMRGNQVLIGSSLGSKSDDRVVAAVVAADPTSLLRQTEDWWKQYWAEVPAITLPDPVLQEVVNYGLYKQACATPPQGIASTLQGPFMEEYQLPPWSNDYHFNINIEMIYWPALATNRLSHFDPLWAMIKTWMPQLKENGEKFFGRNGALMLPHAVDDRCHVVGSFWSGTIDHACTAWMAQMAWLHYRYSGDKKIAEEMAWPLLEGAFEGYWAMLEEVAGGKRLSLPISVSPEYRGDNIDAWGRDASFQLAALHRIVRTLPQAASLLGKPVDKRWADVAKRLPPYTTVEGEWIKEWHLSNKRIGLWQGLDLAESHRHHSHLGAIYPFATISREDTTHRAIIDNSLTVWKYRGAGGWTGWCVPWASIIWSRCGETEAAVNWLHYWKDNFTNEGRGTLHNAVNEGVAIWGAPAWSKKPDEPNREVMQLDAGFGALTAVLELLVQSREDAIYLLPNLHRDWKELKFENIRAEGAFQISATVNEGKIQEVRIKSLVGGTLRLAHNLGSEYSMNGATTQGTLLTKVCKAGEDIILKRIVE